MKKKKDDENLTPWARYQKEHNQRNRTKKSFKLGGCLLYTSDAADE